jgi:hypothetical protein
VRTPSASATESSVLGKMPQATSPHDTLSMLHNGGKVHTHQTNRPTLRFSTQQAEPRAHPHGPSHGTGPHTPLVVPSPPTFSAEMCSVAFATLGSSPRRPRASARLLRTCSLCSIVRLRDVTPTQPNDHAYSPARPLDHTTTQLRDYTTKVPTTVTTTT